MKRLLHILLVQCKVYDKYGRTCLVIKFIFSGFSVVDL